MTDGATVTCGYCKTRFISSPCCWRLKEAEAIERASKCPAPKQCVKGPRPHYHKRHK
jgi:hypothetical protein